MTFWNDSTILPKQAHRWVFSFTGDLESEEIPHWVIKKIKKPSFTIKATQHKYLFTHTFNYPTQVVWEPISITLADVFGASSGANNRFAEGENTYFNSPQAILFNKLTTQFGYNIPNDAEGNVNLLSQTVMKDKLQSLAGTNGYITIKELDGDGNTIESWHIYNPMITRLSFGELSYDSDAIVDITLDISYDWAELIKIDAGGLDDAIKEEQRRFKFYNDTKIINEEINAKDAAIKTTAISVDSPETNDKKYSYANKDISSVISEEMYTLNSYYNPKAKEPFTKVPTIKAGTIKDLEENNSELATIQFSSAAEYVARMKELIKKDMATKEAVESGVSKGVQKAKEGQGTVTTETKPSGTKGGEKDSTGGTKPEQKKKDGEKGGSSPEPEKKPTGDGTGGTGGSPPQPERTKKPGEDGTAGGPEPEKKPSGGRDTGGTPEPDKTKKTGADTDTGIKPEEQEEIPLPELPPIPEIPDEKRPPNPQENPPKESKETRRGGDGTDDTLKPEDTGTGDKGGRDTGGAPEPEKKSGGTDTGGGGVKPEETKKPSGDGTGGTDTGGGGVRAEDTGTGGVDKTKREKAGDSDIIFEDLPILFDNIPPEDIDVFFPPEPPEEIKITREEQEKAVSKQKRAQDYFALVVDAIKSANFALTKEGKKEQDLVDVVFSELSFKRLDKVNKTRNGDDPYKESPRADVFIKNAERYAIEYEKQILADIKEKGAESKYFSELSRAKGDIQFVKNFREVFGNRLVDRNEEIRQTEAELAQVYGNIVTEQKKLSSAEAQDDEEVRDAAYFNALEKKQQAETTARDRLETQKAALAEVKTRPRPRRPS